MQQRPGSRTEAAPTRGLKQTWQHMHNRDLPLTPIPPRMPATPARATRRLPQAAKANARARRIESAKRRGSMARRATITGTGSDKPEPLVPQTGAEFAAEAKQRKLDKKRRLDTLAILPKPLAPPHESPFCPRGDRNAAATARRTTRQPENTGEAG